MEMISIFNTINNVPNILSIDYLSKFNIFDSTELDIIARSITNQYLSIGIKKLLNIIEMVKYINKEDRALKFIEIINEHLELVGY